MILRYTFFWLILLIVAIFNGMMRGIFLLEPLGELTAHQVSTVTALILFFITTWLLNRKWKITTASEAIHIGLIWVLLTIAFEFLFGHFMMGHTWKHLFNDYNLLAGRVWVIALLGVFFLPFLVYNLSKKT